MRSWLLRRELRSDPRAQGAHRVEAVAAHSTWIALLQPIVQSRLGGGDDRRDRPQGVVQVEADHSRGAHLPILPSLRLQLQPSGRRTRGETRMRAHRLILALALLGAAAAGPARARAPSPPTLPPFTVQDLVRLARVSDPAVSPDGKRVAYTARMTDMDANKGRTAIWLLDIRKHSAAPVRLTDLSGELERAEWGADGRFLYYLSNRSGSSQVWRLSVAKDPGSDPIQVTNLPLDVGLLPDLAESRSRLFNRRGVSELCRPSPAPRSGSIPPRAQRSTECSMTTSSCGTGIRGATGGARNSLPSRSTLGGRERLARQPHRRARRRRAGEAVRRPRGLRGESRRSQRGVLDSGLAGGRALVDEFRHLLVPAAGGTPRNLTADNPAWDGQPAFSPNGATLAYLAMDRPGYEADRFHLVLLEPAERRQASAHPKAGTGRLRNSPGRVTARPCSRPPITSASIRYGPSTPPPAGPLPLPATAM